jgi:hypothetical protein
VVLLLDLVGVHGVGKLAVLVVVVTLAVVLVVSVLAGDAAPASSARPGSLHPTTRAPGQLLGTSDTTPRCSSCSSLSPTLLE